jgi:serine protease inhibitor
MSPPLFVSLDGRGRAFETITLPKAAPSDKREKVPRRVKVLVNRRDGFYAPGKKGVPNMSRQFVVALLIGAALSLAIGASRCSEKSGAGNEPVSDRTGSGTLPGDSQKGSGSTDSKSIVRTVDDGSAPGTRRLTSIDNRMIQGNAAFAFQLLRNTCGCGKTENIFVSPLSVSVALSMALNGAAGKTAEEMAGVLGVSGVTLDELNGSMADLETALENADSAVALTVANSLWSRKGFELRPDFLRKNTEFYRAETASLDFSDPGAPAVINGWVNKSTRGLIDKIVDSVSRETMLYLINAIYFKGRWQAEFDPSLTQDGVFHPADGGKKKAPMMNRSGSFRYGEDPALQVVRLPYGGGRIAMYIFLPRAADGLGDLLGTLDERSLGEWAGKLRSRDGDVSIPRFKIAYECGLVPALKAMGIKSAFDAGSADFSGMSDQELFISEVKHKAVVDVNEEGTEAAAVTSIEMRATSVQEPQERFSFVADRPFFFVIRDDASGALLFMGTLYDPSS